MISHNAASILFKVANAQAPKQIQQTTMPMQPASNNQAPQGSATPVAPSAQQKPVFNTKNMIRGLAAPLAGYMVGNPAIAQRARQSIQKHNGAAQGVRNPQTQQPVR